MQNILINWIACWKHFVIKILFQEANFSPHHTMQLLELALVLFLLSIWILDNYGLAQIVKIRMNSLQVLFQDGSSSSYFLTKQFKFGANVNYLDHLNCNHGALAVLNHKILYQEANFSLSIKAVVGNCPCAILLTIWISDCLCFAYMVEIRTYSMSVLF